MRLTVEEEDTVAETIITFFRPRISSAYVIARNRYIVFAFFRNNKSISILNGKTMVLFIDDITEEMLLIVKTTSLRRLIAPAVVNKEDKILGHKHSQTLR